MVSPVPIAGPRKVILQHLLEAGCEFLDGRGHARIIPRRPRLRQAAGRDTEGGVRFVCSKRPIRGDFHNHPAAKGGLVAEADITPHGRGRLAAKLLVFDVPRSLARFWKKGLGHSLGRGCKGAVNALSRTVTRFDKDGKPEWKRYEGDPRYFCIIGLCVGWLSMEIIAHESVHAGFAYEKRVKRNLFGPACDFDEERVAYPAGAIAAAINRFLHAKGLYERKA